MYKTIIRPILFALSQDDAEKAHDLAKRAIVRMQQVPPLISLIAWWYRANHNPRPCSLFRKRVTFPNRIGLAAGFDKHAEMLPFLQALGFGFIEVGTVLPLRQSGNVRPRVFRIPEEEGIINRFGFNSDGVDEVAYRLFFSREQLHIPLGISLGKMKETPNERAADDYVSVLKRLRVYGDYSVANISSPNTPGLRELQGGRYTETLIRTLLHAEAEEAKSFNEPPKPVLLKLAPDLTEQELDETIGAGVDAKVSGFIMGNTTLSRPMKNPDSAVAKQMGGYSGKNLYPLTLKKFRYVRSITHLPMIFVGGLDRTDRIKEAFDSGADLVQLMTSFVYQGPSIVTKARRVI